MKLTESPSFQSSPQKEPLTSLFKNSRTAIVTAVLGTLAACGARSELNTNENTGSGGSAGAQNVGGQAGTMDGGAGAPPVDASPDALDANPDAFDAGPVSPCLSVSSSDSKPKMITKGEEYTSTCTVFSNQCDFPVQLESTEYDIVGIGKLSDLKSHWLVDETNKTVSDIESILQSSGSVILDNLEVQIDSKQERKLCLIAESSTDAECGASVRHEFNSHEHLQFTLPNKEVLPSGYITQDYIEGELTTLGCGKSPTLACRSASSSNPQFIPKGAAGVEFACFACIAGGGDVHLHDLEVQRFDIGVESDIDAVYLYHGDSRLTTGQTIDPQTQSVNFSNLNEVIPEGKYDRFCVVADIASTASTSSRHGFRILDPSKISSDAVSLIGSFPIEGPTMTIGQ